MMVSPAEVEDAIIRMAQKSRRRDPPGARDPAPVGRRHHGDDQGQRPVAIAFAVSSQVDSRVILDAGGAETLLGHGDMLFRPVGSSRLQRLQGVYVGEEEIRAITDHWAPRGGPSCARSSWSAPSRSTTCSTATPTRWWRPWSSRRPAGHGLGVPPAAPPRRRLRPGRAARGRDGADGRGVGHEGSKPAPADRRGRSRPGPAAPGTARRGALRGRLTHRSARPFAVAGRPSAC